MFWNHIPCISDLFFLFNQLFVSKHFGKYLNHFLDKGFSHDLFIIIHCVKTSLAINVFHLAQRTFSRDLRELIRCHLKQLSFILPYHHAITSFKVLFKVSFKHLELFLDQSFNHLSRAIILGNLRSGISINKLVLKVLSFYEHKLY